MNIIDNAISKTDFTAIQDLMLSAAFPWYFNKYTINEQTASDNLNDFQLTHSFYDDNGEYGYIGSEYFDLVKPIIEKLESRCLIRIKANLRTVAPEKDMITGWHTDCAGVYNMTQQYFMLIVIMDIHCLKLVKRKLNLLKIDY